MAQIPFIKMQGLGNDFAVFDNRAGGVPAFDWAKVADRHFGIGCDQVVVLEKSPKADVFMRIFNSDGGEVASCGNAQPVDHHHRDARGCYRSACVGR
jgi:diaminopimelate epimerase